MSDEEMTTSAAPNPDKVGFRDIYRAVSESEIRLTARLDNIANSLAGNIQDHETRLRTIENEGTHLARETQVKAELLAVQQAALVSRVDAHDARFNAMTSASAERSRLGNLSVKTVTVFIVVVNFAAAMVVLFADKVKL